MRPQIDDLRIRTTYTDRMVMQIAMRTREILEGGSTHTRLMLNPGSGKLQATVGGSTTVPREIAVDVGLCLHNMRATLDGLAYQLAWLTKGSRLDAKESKKTQYPIFETKEQFDNQKHADLFKPYIKRLEQFQPYRYGLDEPDPLLILHRLNNIDKHRLLLFVSARVQPIKVDPVLIQEQTHELSPSYYKRIDNLGADAIEGKIIGEFDPAPKPFMINGRFDIQLCFGDDVDLAHGQQVVPILHAISARVAHVVEHFAVDFACATY